MCTRENSMKRGNKSKNCRVQVIIPSLILIIVVLTLIFHNYGEKPNTLFKLSKQKWNSFDNLVEFHPTLEFWNETDLIWQIPSSPKAVLFLAHGCGGRAVNFWDRSPDCPKCIGLPEERLIVLHALARKFAVLTISSALSCWTFGEEILTVKDIIKWWIGKNKLEKLPLVAWGASSGGYFVSALATDLKFSCITLMIAEGLFDHRDITEEYPPTLFVHMPKDWFRKVKVEFNMQVLRKKGIAVSEIQCMEFPLSPNFLSDRIPGLDKKISMKLFELFSEKGFIDKNGYMKNDGRATRWKDALREKKIILPDKNLIHPIQEELNVAYAYHEMSSLQSEQIFLWFESHMS